MSTYPEDSENLDDLLQDLQSSGKMPTSEDDDNRFKFLLNRDFPPPPLPPKHPKLDPAAAPLDCAQPQGPESSDVVLVPRKNSGASSHSSNKSHTSNISPPRAQPTIYSALSLSDNRGSFRLQTLHEDSEEIEAKPLPTFLQEEPLDFPVRLHDPNLDYNSHSPLEPLRSQSDSIIQLLQDLPEGDDSLLFPSLQVEPHLLQTNEKKNDAQTKDSPRGNENSTNPLIGESAEIEKGVPFIFDTKDNNEVARKEKNNQITEREDNENNENNTKEKNENNDKENNESNVKENNEKNVNENNEKNDNENNENNVKENNENNDKENNENNVKENNENNVNENNENNDKENNENNVKEDNENDKITEKENSTIPNSGSKTEQNYNTEKGIPQNPDSVFQPEKTFNQTEESAIQVPPENTNSENEDPAKKRTGSGARSFSMRRSASWSDSLQKVTTLIDSPPPSSNTMHGSVQLELNSLGSTSPAENVETDHVPRTVFLVRKPSIVSMSTQDQKQGPPPLPPKKLVIGERQEQKNTFQPNVLKKKFTSNSLRHNMVSQAPTTFQRINSVNETNDTNNNNNNNSGSSNNGARRRGQGFSSTTQSQSLKKVIQECLEFTGDLSASTSSLSDSGGESCPLEKSMRSSPRFSHTGTTTTPKRVIELHRFFSLLLDSSFQYPLSLAQLPQAEDSDKVVSALVDFYAYFDPTILAGLIKHLVSEEINSVNDPATLFRGSTFGVKMIVTYTKLLASEWLVRALQPAVVEICRTTPESFEVDEVKLMAKNRNIDAQQAQMIASQNNQDLLESCEMVLGKIYQSQGNFSRDLKIIFQDLYEQTEKRFPKFGSRAIAGVFFLRVISPSLLTPEKHLRVPEKYISASSRRKLLLIAKVLQNAANGIEFTSKENYMAQTNGIVLRHKGILQQFFTSLANTNKKDPDSILIETSKMIDNFNILYEKFFHFSKEIEANFQKNPLNSTQNNLNNSLTQLIAVITEPPIFVMKKKHLEVQSDHDETDCTPLYREYLTKAHESDFTRIIARGAVYLGGLDPQDRPTVVIIAEKISTKHFDWDNLFLYLLILLDPIVQRDYSLAYVHSPLNSENTPTFSWLKTSYQVLTRKYKKNLKQVYIVRPSSWIKLTATAFRPFVSTKFWNKVFWLEDVKDLLAHFKNGLILPDELISRK